MLPVFLYVYRKIVIFFLPEDFRALLLSIIKRGNAEDISLFIKNLPFWFCPVYPRFFFPFRQIGAAVSDKNSGVSFFAASKPEAVQRKSWRYQHFQQTYQHFLPYCIKPTVRERTDPGSKYRTFLGGRRLAPEKASAFPCWGAEKRSRFCIF